MPSPAATSTSWVAASPRSTVTMTGCPTSTSPEGPHRRRCTATGARPVARCGSRTRTEPAIALDGVTGAYPARRRRRRPAPTSSSCGEARTSCSAVSATASSPTPTSARASRRRRGWTTAFSATWEAPAAPSHARLRRLPGARRQGERRSLLRRPSSCDRRPTGRLRRRPSPLSPELLHAVDAVQRLGPVRAPRPAGVQRPPLLPRTAQEQLWRIEPGDAPRLYTEADGWQPLQIWGMGIAS